MLGAKTPKPLSARMLQMESGEEIRRERLDWFTSIKLSQYTVPYNILTQYLFFKKLLVIVLSYLPSQDGGIGRYASLPHTTKRRTTTNLKTKNNQNCQKIELSGSPTTEELKKKHSTRLVEGSEMSSQGGEDTQQVGSWWTKWSYICVWINQEEQLGSETDHTTQGSSMGQESLKNLWL